MKKILLSTIFACLAAMAWAQMTVIVSGTVVFGQNQQPAPDYPVWINSPVLDSTGANQNVVFTNENGVYTGIAVIGSDLTLIVSTFDFCIGEVLNIELHIANPIGVNLNNLNFHVCQDILPPPPPDGCAAFFVAEPVDSASLTILFHDLSYSETPIESWAWDFGDGATAEGPAPQHTYEAEGIYIVTLTITADSCTATFTGVVYVGGDGDPCICPDVYDPVCIATPNGGGFITFNNACEAECAGFTPDMFVQCDTTGCLCPPFFDPVCIIDEAGDTITFANYCFAECEGYTADEIFSCNPADTCNCPLIYDPVCVLGPDSIELHFPNACFAACEGFGPDAFVACDSLHFPDCYAAFYTEGTDPNSLTVQFTDVSYAGDGTITSWNWHFGDPAGTTSTEQNPTHFYDTPGVYDITLTISTSDSCTSTTTQHICIGGGGIVDSISCQAMFFFTQEDSIGNTFHFQDMSFGNVNSWLWSFGDGTTSTEQNPTHSYTGNGAFVVTLTVIGGDCQSSISMLIFTGDNIWYGNGFNALFVPFIDGLQVFFLNLTSGGEFPYTYEWNFGDGNTGNDFMPIHTYAEAGVYTVTLTVTDANGVQTIFTATLNLITNEFTGQPQFLTASSTNETVERVTGLRAFPNPVSEQLTMEFDARSQEVYRISILTLDGREVQSAAAQMHVGRNQTTFDTRNLEEGMYLLRLQTGSEVRTLKFVKVR